MKHKYIYQRENNVAYDENFFSFYSKDKNCIQHFNLIRRNCYSEIEGLPREFGNDNEYKKDYCQNLIVTYRDRKIIGGGRIIGKKPNAKNRIPLDTDELDLENLFPELNLKNTAYCEFGRISLLKEFRNRDLVYMIFHELVSLAVVSGYKYVFSVAPLGQTRLYKQGAIALGLPYEYKIYKDLKVPDSAGKYGSLAVVISYVELPKSWKGYMSR